MSKEEILTVGKIVGLHGIKGELKVLLFGDLDGFEWKTVFINTGKKQLPCTVKRVRSNKGMLLFELEGFLKREDSEILVGKELGVRRVDLPDLPEGEYYYFDLEGMEVWTDDKRCLGRIINVISTGSNDVFEVNGPLGEVLIPAVEDIIKSIDTRDRKITVHLIEGLLPGEK